MRWKQKQILAESITSFNEAKHTHTHTQTDRQTDRHGVARVTHLNELWLYRRRVDALVVEERLDFFGNTHVVSQVQTSDVSRRYDTVTSKLPDMEFMYS